MVGKLFIVVIASSLFSQVAVPEELVLEFSGTLEGTKTCVPASDAFCGPYTGILRINTNQPGRARGLWHDYTADVVVTFADGQTATCQAFPPELAETTDLSEYWQKKLQYCLLSAHRAAGNTHVQLDANPPLEEELSSVSLVYTYEGYIYDVHDLSQMLEMLLQFRAQGSFWVVGKACSWGPCVDKSVTRLMIASNSTEGE
jgi:hypothetical protein